MVAFQYKSTPSPADMQKSESGILHSLMSRIVRYPELGSSTTSSALKHISIMRKLLGLQSVLRKKMCVCVWTICHWSYDAVFTIARGPKTRVWNKMTKRLTSYWLRMQEREKAHRGLWLHLESTDGLSGLGCHLLRKNSGSFFRLLETRRISDETS